MKLYAKIKNSKGREEGLGDNEQLSVDLYEGNKIQYSVYIEWMNVGDIEEPTMSSIITVRDWRAVGDTPEKRQKVKAKKRKGEKCVALLDYNIPCENIATHGDFCKKCADKIPL